MAGSAMTLKARRQWEDAERPERRPVGEAEGPERPTLRRFIIEHDIPKVGAFESEQMRQAAAKSNQVLNQLAPTSNGPRAISRMTNLLCLSCQRRGRDPKAC
jgi:hypothetical protein